MNSLFVLPVLGIIGTPEIILIVLLVLVLFGAKKIPELMRGAGRGVKEFKDAMNKDYSTTDDDKKPDEPGEQQ
jgi:sec-independent protein translocase protein TatA